MDERDRQPPAEPTGRRRTTRGATVRLLALTVLLAGLGAWAALGGGRALDSAVDFVGALGVWGPALFAVTFALATTALLPGSLLSASAGALFGLPVGATAVVAGATAGAALSFALARVLGRPAVARYTGGGGRLAGIDRFLSRRGFPAVLLLRLVPLFPFAAVNYGAGLSGVRFVPYLAGTVLGILPATLVFTALGGAAREPDSPMLWIAAAGFVALTAGGWWASRLVRSRAPEVDAAVPEADAAAPEVGAAGGRR
ncbi:TVP38/TMEM64 family protein [Streptomyces sp. TR02-1]|uniref:TVP38/TMEM64 family protein n=1 Tax=Streptomyces sp. TR02-1 TaxID=3385977 RepID=UPI0039A2B15E